VLGIYAHPLLDEEDFRDIVYYTSAGIMKKMLPRISDFLRRLSSQTGLRGIPMHAEFRMQKNRLMPIDVNPLRFGSFSLPDLTFFAFGLNHINTITIIWSHSGTGFSQAGEDIFFRVLTGCQKDRREAPDHEGSPMPSIMLDTAGDNENVCLLHCFGRTKDMDTV
jgi:hypothetical protein